MPNFSLHLPKEVLQTLDLERGIVPRSRVITYLLRRCMIEPGYIQGIAGEITQSITKDQGLSEQIES